MYTCLASFRMPVLSSVLFSVCWQHVLTPHVLPAFSKVSFHVGCLRGGFAAQPVKPLLQTPAPLSRAPAVSAGC